MTYRNAEARLPARKAVTAFWRGVFCGAVGVAILGSVAAWLT